MAALLLNDAFKKRLSYEVVQMDSEYLQKVMQLIKLMEPQNLVYNEKRRCYSIDFANLSQFVLKGIKKLLSEFREQEDAKEMKDFDDAIAQSKDFLPQAPERATFKRVHSLQTLPTEGTLSSSSLSSLGLSPRSPGRPSGTAATPSFVGPNIAQPVLPPQAGGNTRLIGPGGVPLSSLTLPTTNWSPSAPPSQLYMAGAGNTTGINMNYRQYPNGTQGALQSSGLASAMASIGSQSPYSNQPYGGFTPTMKQAQQSLVNLGTRLQPQPLATQSKKSRKRVARVARPNGDDAKRTAKSTKKGAAAKTRPRQRKTATAATKRNKSKGPSDAPYKCDFVDPKTGEKCTAAFRRRSGLSSHKRIHTGEKPYECTICHRRFPNSSNCNAHMRSHKKIKPYKCDFPGCDKAYTHSTSLKEHKCKHTGDFLHQCPDCGRKFTVNSNYKRHRQNVDCKAKLLKAKRALKH